MLARAITRRGARRVHQGGVHRVVAEGQYAAHPGSEGSEVGRAGLVGTGPGHQFRALGETVQASAGQGFTGGEDTLLHVLLQ
ncbi:hypothetical protein ACRAWF_16560 [Streptomyces sp. L7]